MRQSFSLLSHQKFLCGLKLPSSGGRGGLTLDGVDGILFRNSSLQGGAICTAPICRLRSQSADGADCGLKHFGTAEQRVFKGLQALRQGDGVLVVDDEDRENEGDLIYAAATISVEQMALLIRRCSGIVCLCLPEEHVQRLNLPMMVTHNTNHHRTAFTVSIEAAQGVTTGVSAADRVTTIRTAIADDAGPETLCRPGHVFPLAARPGGVLERRGHTEATVDLMPPAGVLCELTNDDGSMARLPEIITFAEEQQMTVLSVADLVAYRSALHTRHTLTPSA